MTRIIVADDHAIVRAGLVQMLTAQPDLQVVAEAANADETVRAVRETPCDVLLLDLNMPGDAGVPLIARLRAANEALPILVLSMHQDPMIVSRALKAGASGYLSKGSPVAQLLDAVRTVAGGGKVLDTLLIPSVVFAPRRDTAVPHDALSDRELQVLGLIAAGLRVGDIADQLHVSAKTVSTHKMRLMHKLGIDNVAGLVRYADEHGLRAVA
jgi:DNA-binding NarL/FixJ family response regulator